MKKILARRKFLRINTPASFGILCAVMIILIGSAAYALASGVIAPAVKKAQPAQTVLAEESPAPAAETPTPDGTPDVEAIEGGVVTTTDPETGETVVVTSDAPTAAPESLPLEGVTIAIDAAKSKEGKHQGVASKTYEYLINFAFSQEVQKKLTELGATVVMTRENNDEVVTAEDRVKKVNGADAAILVSIFCNDLTNNTTRGAEAFVASKSSDESRKLAQTVLRAYVKATGMPLRYSEKDSIRKTSDRKVLSDSTMPAMGLVLGQLSNRSDDANLNDTAFVQIAAEGIVNGIREYLGK